MVLTVGRLWSASRVLRQKYTVPSMDSVIQGGTIWSGLVASPCQHSTSKHWQRSTQVL